MLKTALVFVIGLLLGANLVYFFMAGRPQPATSTPSAEPVAAPAAKQPPGGAARPATKSSTPNRDASPTASARGGALLIPVQGIRAEQLSDTYGDARGSDRSHNAMDIMAPTGTPVLAVSDGRLAKIFDSKAGGLTLYQFDPSETYNYYYAHLDRYAEGLTEGQMLRRGQVIGYVGSTGNANPAAPHLHFAVYRLGPEKRWHEGAPINPYPLLRG